MNDKELIEKLKADIDFLLTFAPKEKPFEKLLPMFYLTCTYEGDYDLWEKVEKIRNERTERIQKTD